MKIRADKTKITADRQNQDEVTIPVVEEKLDVSKRRVNTGRIRVKKTVEHHTERVQVPVTRENVEVRHVAVNEPVDEIPQIREEGNVTIIPVTEEVVVVTKKLVLREEIHLVRTEKTETVEQEIDIASERAEINRLTGED